MCSCHFIAVFTEHKGKPFVDFLKSKRLPPNICHFVQHAIAMVTDNATAEEVRVK